MAPRPDDCIAQLFVCRTRVCLLDADGTPTVGAGSVYVSDALQKLTITPVYEDGDEVKEKNGCGTTFIDFLQDPSLTRCDIATDFLSPDPYLHELMLPGSSLLTSTDKVGWAMPPIGTQTGQISLEFWTNRIDKGNLSSFYPYAHWALPFCKSMRMGARELSSSAQHGLIDGQAVENLNWFDGPGNDWPVASDRCVQWLPTDTLPDVACGPAALAGS